MIKIFAVGLVMLSSCMTGFILAKDLNERVKVLKEIKQMAIYIKSDFEYRSPMLADCFEHRGSLFGKASRYMEEGALLPEEALKKSADELKSITKEDRTVIYSFADNLSIEDVNGQIANVKWLIETLEKRIKEAEYEYTTKGRLYKSTGALTGLGIVILLL